MRTLRGQFLVIEVATEVARSASDVRERHVDERVLSTRLRRVVRGPPTLVGDRSNLGVGVEDGGLTLICQPPFSFTARPSASGFRRSPGGTNVAATESNVGCGGCKSACCPDRPAPRP